MLIDSDDLFQNFLKSFEYVDCEFIAVDTEFIKNRYTEKLCLIQIHYQDTTSIIDLQYVDLLKLKPIFENKNIIKVFHGAEQDLDLLFKHGIFTVNFFDTQLAEQALSNEYQISYKNIVLKYLNKNISKNITLTSWDKRPLSEEQIQYAAYDVIYLAEVYKMQMLALSAHDRLSWVDFSEMSDKIFGKKDKSDNDDDILKSNKIFQELLDWRNNIAVENDLPVEKIIPTKLLKLISQKKLKFLKSIARSNKLPLEFSDQFVEVATSIIEKNTTPMVKKNKHHDNIVNLLTTALGVCSANNNVCSSLIASKNDLIDALDCKKKSRIFIGWRNEIFGKVAKEILEGSLSLKISNGEVQFKS